MTSLFQEVSPGAAEDTPTRQITVTVNGESRTAVVEPRLVLAHLLRQAFHLTGTHTGCDTSNCGACTVLFDGTPVKSCTMFAVQADGHEVMTVEGLAGPSELHAIQEGFKEEHGLQCGFCTPGHDDGLQGPARREPESDRRRDPMGIERQSVPLHRLSEHRQGCHVGGKEAGGSVDDGCRRDQDRRHGRQPAPCRGQPIHPRQGQLRRRHRAARDAPHGDPAQPSGPRQDQVDRRLQGVGDARCPPGADRRDHGRPQPGLDAHVVVRHPGGAGHRQGSLPGSGGRLCHRRRPLYRQGRLRGDRRGLRTPPADRQPDAIARRGSAPDQGRQGEPVGQRDLRLGGGRQGRNRPGLRSGRSSSRRSSSTTRVLIRRRSSAVAPSPTSTGRRRSSRST